MQLFISGVSFGRDAYTWIATFDNAEVKQRAYVPEGKNLISSQYSLRFAVRKDYHM